MTKSCNEFDAAFEARAPPEEMTVRELAKRHGVPRAKYPLASGAETPLGGLRRNRP